MDSGVRPKGPWDIAAQNLASSAIPSLGVK